MGFTTDTARQAAKASARTRRKKAADRRKEAEHRERASTLAIEGLSIIDFMGRYSEFDASSWDVWRSILKGAFCVPMDPREREIFTDVAQREPPPEPVQEFYAVKGRRGGGSYIAALVATYLGVCRDYSPYLNRGERGVCLFLAADRRQARVCHSYVEAFLSTP